MQRGAREVGDRRGHGGCASNLPSGSGLGWRAELGGEAGVRPEATERQEPRCEATALSAGRDGVGGALEVSCLGRRHRGGEGAEQVRRGVLGVLGSHPPGRLRSGQVKLLEAVSRMGESPGQLAFFPREACSPAQRWVAEGSGGQPARGVAAGCLCGTEAWSRRFQPASAKPASGMPDEPRVLLCPVGAHGGFDGQQARLGGMPSNAAHFFTVQ